MLGRCSSLYSPDLLFLPMYQHIMLYFRPYRTTKCTPCTPRTLINNPNIFFFSAPSTTAHELIYSYSFHLLDLLVVADSHLLSPPADIFFCIRSWTPPTPPRQSFCPVNKRWPLCSHCLWNKVRKKWLCCLYSTMLILNGLSKVPVHFAFVSVVAPGWMWNIELCIRTEAHRPQDHHCCCCCFESWDPSRRPHLIAWLETPAVTSLIGAQPQVLPSNSNTFLLCFSAYWLVRDENKLDLK